MISILGGEIISALGDKVSRQQHLYHGTFQHTLRDVDVIGERQTVPYYAINSDLACPDLFDPMPALKQLVQQAINQLGLGSAALARCGLFIGNAANDLSLSIPLGINQDGKQIETINRERIGNGYYAQQLITHFGLNSLTLTYNTACTSSSNAIIDAAAMLEGKLIDYALVIGMEMYAPLSFEGFISMQLLAPQAISPFDSERQGLILGESISGLFLSRDEVAPSEWRFLGGSSRCETHSVTGVNPDGSGIAEVINSALNISAVTPSDVTAVKAHGTASRLSDLAEINGMKQVFSEQPDFYSLKPYIGHTLGSCGVSELLLSIECIDAGFLPPTPNFLHPDPEMMWQPISSTRHCEHGVFVHNCFGFGGNNSVMVVEKVAS
ncbi:beta-ketoacyl synthase N-terminal-like domain-containing protein [Aliivibrio kagoshimensis]|uniref:beta-ketoacyl synthase N-terminal-like domain-containing protein n=1 Tax=Aliivibrio kagoshimensis TaxID=2910230 RepID=UPI003D0DD6DE